MLTKTPPRAEPWAAHIRAAVGKSVEAVLALGHVLIQAKAALPHGEWSRLFSGELVPFSVGTAQRLMAIAEHPVLSKAAHAPCLPPSWTSLYELTKVDPQRLAAALGDGRISQAMHRADVQALLPQAHETSSEDAESELKSEHCDVRIEWMQLRVLQFAASRQNQTVADFVRLGLWSVIHDSLSEGQVKAIIAEATAHPRVTNRRLEQVASEATA